jgi:hypothetical protein
MGMVLSRCGCRDHLNARRDEQPHVSRLGEAGWGWYNGADRDGDPWLLQVAVVQPDSVWT